MSEEHVRMCVLHLEALQQTAKIRSTDRFRKREEEDALTYEMYDWLSLTLSGTLSKLKVKELDKYLERHNLSKKGKKHDKMKAIMADCLRKSVVDNAKLSKTK